METDWRDVATNQGILAAIIVWKSQRMDWFFKPPTLCFQPVDTDFRLLAFKTVRE